MRIVIVELATAQNLAMAHIAPTLKYDVLTRIGNNARLGVVEPPDRNTGIDVVNTMQPHVRKKEYHPAGYAHVHGAVDLPRVERPLTTTREPRHLGVRMIEKTCKANQPIEDRLRKYDRHHHAG
jgi:hypothetical protein